MCHHLFYPSLYIVMSVKEHGLLCAQLQNENEQLEYFFFPTQYCIWLVDVFFILLDTKKHAVFPIVKL